MSKMEFESQLDTTSSHSSSFLLPETKGKALAGTPIGQNVPECSAYIERMFGEFAKTLLSLMEASR